MKIKHGLCGMCYDEIYAATWGLVRRKTVSDKMPEDAREAALKHNREAGMGAKKEFDRRTKEAEADCAVVANYFDDFARGDGHIDFLMCERHLQDALSLLVQGD